MASRTWKDKNFSKQNAGSGIIRICQVNPSTLAILASTEAYFTGELGTGSAIWYELPFINISDDLDLSAQEEIQDETLEPYSVTTGKQTVQIHAKVAGSYLKVAAAGSTKSITNATKTAQGLVTLSVSAHGYIAGQALQVVAVTTPTKYNGNFPIYSVPTSGTLTYYHPEAVVDTGGANTGTVDACNIDSLRNLVLSFKDLSATFKVVYYKRLRDVQGSTVGNYEKLVFWNGVFESNWKDEQGGSTREHDLIINCLKHSTRDQDDPFNLRAAFYVNAPQTLASETAELQTPALS